MFRGHEPEKGHEPTGGIEAHEVVKLGHQRHGGEGVDASEATKGADHLGVGSLLARHVDMGVESTNPFFRVFDGEEVILEDDLVGGVLEAQAAQPESVPLAPGSLASRPQPSSAEQELAQAVPAADQVLMSILPGTAEIADRLILF